MSGHADDPLDALAAGAQGAADALADLEDSAKKAQPALKSVGDAAGKAGDEVKKTGEKASSAASIIITKMKDAAREALGFESATKEASAATNTMSAAFGNLVTEGISRAVAGLEEWIGQIPESIARGERHAQALQQLGEAYGYVQQATNGAVSAEQAAGVQQRALQSGLRLSAQELAAITARAREFSRATGTELGQALDQLTDQLVDPGEELRKFGVFLQTGMNAGDALRETLRQLQAQTGQTATSQASLTEAMEQASRATTEAKDSLLALIAERLELRDFFTQYASWINDAKNATNGWDEAAATVVGTLREMLGLQSQASARAAQAGQSASGAFTGEAGALAQQARSRGLNLRGVDLGRMGVDATPEQRNRILALLRRAAQGGVNQQALDLEVQGFDLEVGMTADDRAEQTRRAAAAAEAARRAELARRNRASQSASSSSAGGGVRTDEGFGIGTPGFLTDLVRNTFEQLRREFNAARTPADGAGMLVRPPTVGERFGEFQLRGESAAARMGAEGADAPQRRFAGGMFSREAGRAETQQRQERIRVMREQQAALRDLLAASQAEIDTAMRAHRPIAEVNDLIRQRIGIQTALSQSTRDLVAAQEEQVSGFAVVGEKLLDVLAGVADGVAESVVSALEGSKSFGEAMEEMARSTLRALAKMAIVEVLKEGAMALAAAATYRYDAAVQHGIAAGMWGAVAVAAGAGVAAMGSGAKPTPSSTGTGGAARADTSRAARADDRQTGGGGPLTLVVNVSGAAFTDAGVHQAVGTAFREAVGNGVIRREHLNGLLGGG